MTLPSPPLPPPSPQPLSVEGAGLLDAGLAVDAVEVLRRAVAAGEPSATELLVRAYLDSGSWHAAVEWLTPLVEQGDVRFAGRLGVALAEIGDRERAEEALRLAVDSGELAASNDLAILLRDGDRLAEAVQVLVRAADAGDPQAASNLVQLHIEDGDVVAAITAAEQYADEGRPDTVVALADVRSVQSRPDEAEGLYRRAAELGALRAHTAYGQFLLAARGDVAGAEREFREAWRYLEPGWAYTMGRFLLDENRPDEAREFLQAALDGGDEAARQALLELEGGDPSDD